MAVSLGGDVPCEAAAVKFLGVSWAFNGWDGRVLSGDDSALTTNIMLGCGIELSPGLYFSRSR